jgi:hypothetical protein
MWKRKLLILLWAFFAPALFWGQSALSPSQELERDVEEAIANLKRVAFNEARMMKDLELIERSYLDLKSDETIMTEYYERRLAEYNERLKAMASQYGRSEKLLKKSKIFSAVSTTGWTLTAILLIVFISI